MRLVYHFITVIILIFLNHSYNSIKLNKKFAHGRRLFGSSLFQIDEKKRAYTEMYKALELYDSDIYGQWRTYFELWRFNFIDEILMDAKKYSEKLVRFTARISSNLYSLPRFTSKNGPTRSMKSSLNQLLPNFSPSYD